MASEGAGGETAYGTQRLVDSAGECSCSDLGCCVTACSRHFDTHSGRTRTTGAGPSLCHWWPPWACFSCWRRPSCSSRADLVGTMQALKCGSLIKRRRHPGRRRTGIQGPDWRGGRLADRTRACSTSRRTRACSCRGRLVLGHTLVSAGRDRSAGEGRALAAEAQCSTNVCGSGR